LSESLKHDASAIRVVSGQLLAISFSTVRYLLSASAAHTARVFARMSAGNATGAGFCSVGAICAFMDTVAERRPLGLAAINWV
jgi:hypothetical protein